MPDWNYINAHRVTKPERTVHPRYITVDTDGFNGLFRFTINGKLVRCVVSDGAGWKHVSVSIEYESKPPTWAIMCAVKDIFWDPEDCVVQFHPPKSVYVNFHPGCLHLWEYTGGGPFKMPIPHAMLVGPKGQ